MDHFEKQLDIASREEPIPFAQFCHCWHDWCFGWFATHEPTYDGAIDSHSPMGNGRTKAEAIADLKEQMEERGMRLYPKRVVEPTQEDLYGED